MKENSFRIRRIEKEICRNISHYLLFKMQHDFVGIITITRANISKDLRNAKVYVHFMPQDEELKKSNETKEVLNYLNNNSYLFQRYIASQIRMRFCPKITFFEDDLYYKVLKVEKILHEL